MAGYSVVTCWASRASTTRLRRPCRRSPQAAVAVGVVVDALDDDVVGKGAMTLDQSGRRVEG